MDQCPLSLQWQLDRSPQWEHSCKRRKLLALQLSHPVELGLPILAIAAPYWIIKVPKEIIPDHTGIWFDSSLDMMAALYVITTDNQITSQPRTATMTTRQ